MKQSHKKMSMVLTMAAASALASQKAYAATLGQYSFTGTSTVEADRNSVNAQPANAVFSAFTRFGGVNYAATNNVYNTSNWTVSPDSSRYTGFSITANPGFKLDLNFLQFDTQRSGSGPLNGEVRYSFDGFASSHTYTPSLTTSSPLTVQWDFPDLSTLAGGTVEFRFYGSGATASSGTYRWDNVILDGSVVAASTRELTWAPSLGQNNWNTSAGNQNWLDENLANVAFANNDNPIFTDAGLANGSTVNIDAGGVTAGVINVQNTAGTYTFQGGSIGGTGPLIKTGAGALVINNSNGYGGGTQINGGSVSIASDSALGAGGGGISFNGGTLITTAAIASARAITLNAGGGTIDTSGNNVSFNATTGNGALTKNGSGDLALSGTFGAAVTPNPVTVNAGSLTFTGPGTAHLASAGAGTMNGNIVIAGNGVSLANVKRVNFSTGTFSGSGQIEVQNDWAAISVAGSNSGLTPVISNNIALNSLGGVTKNTLIGVSSPASGTTNVLTINGQIAGDANVIFAADQIGTSFTTGQGTGIVVLNNASNNWSGSTTVANAPAGVVRLGASNALPTGTALIFGVDNNPSGADVAVGAIDLNGNNQTVASLSSHPGSVANGIANTGGAATFTINGSASTNYGGSIGIPANTSNLAGANDNIALVLHAGNTGVQTLSGASTYSGGTTISGGTLLAANATGSATGSGAVQVNGGGTLGGTGSITGAVTVASGGIIAPGASIGTLSLASLTLNSGSFLAFEVGSGGADSVLLTGPANNLSASGASFAFASSGTPTPGFYTLIDYAGAIGGGGFAGLSNSTPTVAGHDLALMHNTANTSVDLEVTISGVAMRTWNGAPGNTWSTASGNFQDAGNFADGQQARFDDSASGSGTVAISGTVEPAWTYFNNSTKSYTLNGGVIGGAGGLAKTGSGNVTISGSHTFTGPVSVRAGVVQIDSIANQGVASAIGAGSSVTIGAGGTLRYTGLNASSNRSITLDSGGSTIDVASGSTDLQLDGAISGAGGLTKAGSGRLLLANPANSYAGATTITAGQLQNLAPEVIPNGSALTVASGAAYNMGGNDETVGSIAGAGAITVDAVLTAGGDGASTVFSGSINGSGNLTKTGAGTLSLSGSNGLSGALNVNGGFVAINAAPAIANVSGVTLTTGGGLRAQATLSTDRVITIGTGGGALDANAGATLTLTSALPDATGTAIALTKSGDGTVNLAAPSTRNDPTIINGGAVMLSATDSEKRNGLGTGTITVNSGGTLHVANVEVGQAGSTSPPQTETRPGINLNDGSTLMGSGNTDRGGGSIGGVIGGNDIRVTTDAGAVVDLKTQAAGDVLIINSALRNNPGNVTSASDATIRVNGPGRVVLASGASSSSLTPSSTQFTGSWLLESGILQLGPHLTGGFGETLNALGYLPADGPNGPGRPITITGGILAGGAEGPNLSPTSPIDASTYRSPITLSGGAIASTGVNATFAGNITIASNSSIHTTDPVDNISPRTVNISTQNLLGGSRPTNGNITWGNANLTVQGAGTVIFNRNLPLNTGEPTSAVSVTPGATLTINPSATVELAGTQDALSDGVNHVNVINNSTASLAVKENTKNVGAVSGVGNTSVDSGATLIATSIRQNTLTANGNVQLRENPTPSTSKLTTLNLGGSQTLDMGNNKLIITSFPGGAGTYSGGTYNGVAGLVSSGFGTGGAPFWDGTGIVTSMTAATSGISTTLAVSSASGAGKTTFGGLPVSGSDALVMYTYNGDANLSGNVDADDYWIIDSNYNDSGTKFGFNNGDFDYDGDIDGDDYLLIDAGFSASQAGPPLGGAAAINGVTAVPEPASIGLLGLAVAGLVRRRRRA